MFLSWLQDQVSLPTVSVPRAQSSDKHSANPLNFNIACKVQRGAVVLFKNTYINHSGRFLCLSQDLWWALSSVMLQVKRPPENSSTNGSYKHPSGFSTLRKSSSGTGRGPRPSAAALCYPLVARCSMPWQPHPASRLWQWPQTAEAHLFVASCACPPRLQIFVHR